MSEQAKAAYDFAKEATLVCEAIGSEVGNMTVQCALHEAFAAGASEGCLLRDDFAKAALQGMCAGLTRFRTDEGMEDIIIHRPADVSEIAYVYADAMLAAREPKP